MAYSGLETLFQNLGPTTASSFAGEREGIAQGLDQISAATQQQALQKALQDYQQAQVMNPLDAQFKQGQIASQKAQLPGLEGLSKSQVAKGNVDHATQEQDILKAISDGKLKVTENQLKEQETLAGMAGNLGQILKGQDPRFHEDTRRRFLEANGIDPNSSGGKEALTASPDQLISTANKITDMGKQMRQAIAVADIQANSHTAGIAMQGKNAKEIEQMRIDAGKYDKSKVGTTVEMALLKADTPTKKAEILEQAYAIASEAGDEESATKYAKRAVEARQRKAEDERNKGIAKPGIDTAAVANLPANPTPSATAPIAGSAYNTLSIADMRNAIRKK